MYRLRAVPRSSNVLKEGPPVHIGVGANGNLTIHCDDDATFEWVSSLLQDRIFVPMQGFPRLQRDDAGRLVRSRETGQYVVLEHIDFSATPERLLQAIEDGLEASEAFVLTRVP